MDFNYLTENILTDGHWLTVNAIMPYKFDRLNFNGLAGKRRKRLHQNFALCGIQRGC